MNHEFHEYTAYITDLGLTVYSDVSAISHDMGGDIYNTETILKIFQNFSIFASWIFNHDFFQDYQTSALSII